MSKKKKVCILQNGLSRGGTDTFVVNLCRYIDKTHFEVTVVNPSSKEGSRIHEQDVIDSGADIVHTSDLGKGLKSLWKHFRMLYILLRGGKYDVFHTNVDLFNGPQLFVAWLAGVPVRCCHSHNTMQQKSIVEGMTLSVHMYQAIMKWMCWVFSNRRIGCSEDAMNFLFGGKKWKTDKYPTIIYNGIELNYFKNLTSVMAKKNDLNLAKRYNVLTVGRIIPQKNPQFIAQVFCEVCKMHDDVDLVWVGVGDLENECRNILSQNNILDRTHFLGSRNDVNEIMQCCDAFILPSNFEGLGIVLIEAQAAGLPCLASDTVPELANRGAVKFLALDRSARDWAIILCDIVDRKIKLDVDNKKLLEFSVKNMIEQMEAVYS